MLLLTTSLGAFLTPFISTAISFGVPRIGTYFHLNFFDAAFLPLVILIPLVSFMLLFGKISDGIGRVKLFRIGLIIFLMSSLLAPYTRNYDELVASVFAIGLGGALLSTNSTAIIGYAFSEEGRGLALGINAMSIYLGLTLAPFLGGFLIEFFGWQYIFLAVAPIPVISLLISFLSMKDLEIKSIKITVNIRGSALFAALMISVALYLSLGFLIGFLKASFLLIAFAVFFVLFVRDETRSTNPVVPVDMIRRNRAFIASNVAAYLNFASTFSIVFVFSIYLQVILHVSPFLSGLIILPEPVLMVALSPFAGRLSDMIGSRMIASVGMVVIGISFVSFYFLSSPNRVEVMFLLAVLGVGYALFSPPNTNSVMGSVRKERSGIASGFLGTMRFTGQLSSIILATFVLSEFMPKSLTLGIFSGIYVQITPEYFNGFINGFRTVMIISAILSFSGAVISLLRTKIRNG